jgi:hypothetical protein
MNLKINKRRVGMNRFMSIQGFRWTKRIALYGLFTVTAVGFLGMVAAERANAADCTGPYALCAASICQPTGKSITVNVASGGTAVFPEANCTCPIFTGTVSVGNGFQGNMRGSCSAPQGRVWSAYSAQTQIPQEITGWAQTSPEDDAPAMVCSAALNLGSQSVNCGEFLCEVAGMRNGVPVAICHCPIGETVGGVPVSPNTTFLTQAGQGNTAYCAAHPVSRALR